MIIVKEQRNLAKLLGVKRFSTLKIDQLRIAIDDRKKELEILLKKLQKEPEILCEKCALKRLESEMVEQSKKEKNQSRCVIIDNDMEIDVGTGEVLRSTVDNYKGDAEYL